MKTITKLCFLFFFLASAQLVSAQWVNDASGTSNTPQTDNLGIGTVSNSGVKVEFDVEASEGLSAVLRLDVDEKWWDLDVTAAGALNFNPNAGNQMLFDGSEFLWYNGTYFSWGFGADYNFFADEVVIGDNTIVPSEFDGLTLTGSEDLRMEGTGAKYIRFTESGSQKAFMGHSGTNMFVRNQEVGGDLYLDGEVELYLQTNSSTKMTIDAAGEVGIGTTAPAAPLHVSGANVRIEDTGSKFLDFYAGTTRNGFISSLSNDNMQVQSLNGGGIFINSADRINFNVSGATLAASITPAGDFGIGTTSPSEKLEVAGLVKSQGGTVQATGASATELVERTDGSAMLFGAGNNAGFTIDEAFAFHVRARPRSFLLSRSLSGGDYLMVSDGGSSNSAFGFSSAAAATHRLRVNGSVQATSYAIISDRKLKKDVNAFDVGLDAVKKINPVTYVYNGKAGIECDATQVGMMAQDLQKIAPILVKEETYFEENVKTGKSEAKDTYLAINDTGIKYILINAIKELSTEADAKDERIETLETELASMKDAIAQIQAQLAVAPVTSDVQTSLAQKDVVINGTGNVAELAQNQPNPFNENTTINYFLPEGTAGAHMTIFSAEGKVLKTVKIDEAGNGQINLKANSLPAGNYMYQLATDAGVIGSKTMVIAK